MERVVQLFFQENADMRSERRHREEEARNRICGTIHEDDFVATLFPRDGEEEQSQEFETVESGSDSDPSDPGVCTYAEGKTEEEEEEEEDEDATDSEKDEVTLKNDSQYVAVTDEQEATHSEDDNKKATLKEDDMSAKDEDKDEAAYKHCRTAMQGLSANTPGGNEDKDLLQEESKLHPCPNPDCDKLIPGDAGRCSCGTRRPIPAGGFLGWNGTKLADSAKCAKAKWRCPTCWERNNKAETKCVCCETDRPAVIAVPAPGSFNNSGAAPTGTCDTTAPTTGSFNYEAAPAPELFNFGVAPATTGSFTFGTPAAPLVFDFGSLATGSFSFGAPATTGTTDPGSPIMAGPESGSPVPTPTPVVVPAAAGLPPWTPLVDIQELRPGDNILVNGVPAVFLSMSRRRLEVRMENGTIKFVSSDRDHVQVRHWD